VSWVRRRHKAEALVRIPQRSTTDGYDAFMELRCVDGKSPDDSAVTAAGPTKSENRSILARLERFLGPRYFPSVVVLALALAPGDEITQGLDGLAKRLDGYKEQGARFAKWRAVYNVSDTLPSRLAVEANAHALARYAAICQQQGVVPIVEPEVLIDGDHSLARCAEVTEFVLHEVFHALQRHRVALELMLLKSSMVVPGENHERQATPAEVAAETIRVLRRTVPAAVPSINFLSGGQTPVEATANLDAINRSGAQPWLLSFSYGRALQEPALQAWKGLATNARRCQEALIQRARLNSAASRGTYSATMEVGR